MNLKVNACSPSFGMVSEGAVKLAKESRSNANVVDLVKEQEKNLKYHIMDTLDFEMRSCFAVFTNGKIIERFNSFPAACAFASAVEKAAKENGAL